MPLEPIRLERKEARDSYAAMFSNWLLRPERETPSLIAGPKGKGAVKRYSVYRNNVTVSLIEALAAIFPAVRRITGEEFFGAMARFHIRETPPSSPRPARRASGGSCCACRSALTCKPGPACRSTFRYSGPARRMPATAAGRAIRSASPARRRASSRAAATRRPNGGHRDRNPAAHRSRA